MANEKKTEKVCEGCCGMCGTCGIIGGVLLLLSGGAFLLYGLNSEPGANDAVPGDTMILAAGALLALVALGNLVHALKMCPFCNK